MIHSFHIPVLGLGFTIDTPLKVARYGISSVVTIVDDILIEDMRKFHCEQSGRKYTAISAKEPDSRAKRITTYLNLLNELIIEQFENIKQQDFTPDADITRYFNLLSDKQPLKALYNEMLKTESPSEKKTLEKQLRSGMRPGDINVNIMTKVNKMNYAASGEVPDAINSDAMAALRGFALSDVSSSVVLSAGITPNLYTYFEHFDDFYPSSSSNTMKKKVILKVSDFRSALIQGKFLAKKGIWVSEFRIESGLNCGGHAFATEGQLLGPILEEFKQRRHEIKADLFNLYQKGLSERNKFIPSTPPEMHITAQGGIGTYNEDQFLLNYYELDGTGWGSPFLLVPEVTNVDEETLKNISHTKVGDIYLSNSSPLGIPFNSFKNTSIEKQRLERIERNKPGSPCPKKYLVSNTEFTEKPICTASSQYQKLKIKELKSMSLPEDEYKTLFEKITEKLCLCEGLSVSPYIKNDILKPNQNDAVAICPGPNLIHFQGTFSLDDIVKHIYGKINMVNVETRSHMFINELRLYVDYLKKDISDHLKALNDKKRKYVTHFKDQLLTSIEYYKQLIPKIKQETEAYKQKMREELNELETKIQHIQIPAPPTPTVVSLQHS